MHFNKEYRHETREIELDVCLHQDCWALPIFLSWRGICDVGRFKGRFRCRTLVIALHILCVSFHFTWWKWGE